MQVAYIMPSAAADGLSKSHFFSCSCAVLQYLISWCVARLHVSEMSVSTETRNNYQFPTNCHQQMALICDIKSYHWHELYFKVRVLSMHMSLPPCGAAICQNPLTTYYCSYWCLLKSLTWTLTYGVIKMNHSIIYILNNHLTYFPDGCTVCSLPVLLYTNWSLTY